MRDIDYTTEFKCIHCGFPNSKEMKYCAMCRRDENAEFYPENKMDSAVLAERERCAKIMESEVGCLDPQVGCASRIADLIRKGG